MTINHTHTHTKNKWEQDFSPLELKSQPFRGKRNPQEVSKKKNAKGHNNTGGTI
jgi:hypothetical protein